jgi:hypothetical protein
MTVESCGNLEKRENRGAERRIRQAAERAIAGAVKAGPAAYDRTRDLPRLIRLDIACCSRLEEASPALIVARLEAALRAERSKARAGHWTYDLNRHIALRQAWLAETARLSGQKSWED